MRIVFNGFDTAPTMVHNPTMLRRLLPRPPVLGRWKLKSDPLDAPNPDPGYVHWSKLPPGTARRRAIEERLKRVYPSPKKAQK